jgi:uncharacterized protein
MMAPAMNTRPDERLPYHELARQGARLVRQVAAGELERLAEVAPGEGELRTELNFRLDDESRAWVSGMVAVTVRATCQRCLAEFDYDLAAQFDLCIVDDQDQASRLGADVDVLVAGADSVTVAEVVEDEVILGVPERLCRTEPCEHAPAFQYPAPAAESESEERRNPFEVLATLKP